MRSSSITLLGLVLAMGCDRTSTTGPTETDPVFAKHVITHLDERTGTFELRGLQGCFGELVIVTGTIRYKEHTMTDPARATRITCGSRSSRRVPGSAR